MEMHSGTTFSTLRTTCIILLKQEIRLSPISSRSIYIHSKPGCVCGLVIFMSILYDDCFVNMCKIFYLHMDMHLHGVIHIARINFTFAHTYYTIITLVVDNQNHHALE